MFKQFIWKCSFLLLLLTSFSVGAQVLTVGDVDPGPYAPGSDISVPVKLNQAFKKGCIFNLFMSDLNGQFTNNNAIGTFNSHFTTFINGIIPARTASGSYKLRVQVINNGEEYFIVYDKTIRITAGTAPKIQIGPTDNSKVLLGEKIWGFCSSVKDNNEIVIKNSSTQNSVVSGVLKNDYQTSANSEAFDFYGSNLHTLKLNIGYYTVTFKARKEDVLSTKSYVIVNSSSKISLQSDGTQTACIPDPASTTEGTGFIRYSVNMGDPSNGNPGSMLANYPGLAYQFDWGDGNIDYITQTELKAAGGIVQHRYTASSCGRPPIDLKVPVYNAYQANIFVEAPFCTGSNTPITTYPKVFQSPVADFDIPGGRGCVNELTTFTNYSIPGQSESADGTHCTTNTSYLWYVKEKSAPESGWQVISDETHFSHRFQQVGVYSVKLLASNSSCTPSQKILDVCIEADPDLQFNLTQTDKCLSSGSGPVILSTTNTSKVNGSCSITWLWKVLDSVTRAELTEGITFLDPPNVPEPRIAVSVPGNYILVLESTNSCKTLSVEHPFTIGGPLTVNLPDVNPKYCKDFPFTLDFENDLNLKPLYTGYAENKNYSWDIKGGNYQFLEESQSQPYPKVKVESPGAYEVSVTYNSECGRPVTDKLILTFYGPIKKDAGPDDIVCDNIPGQARTTYQLHANVPEPQESGQWSVVDGPSDAFISSDTSPNAIIAGLASGVYHLRWTISNDAGCAEYDEMALTVYAKPAAGRLSGNSRVCRGSGGILKLTDFVGQVVGWETSVDGFQWRSLTNSTDQYQFDPIQQKTFFRVNVAGQGWNSGCQTVETSNVFEVDVDPETVGGTTSGEASYCTISPAGQVILAGHTGAVLRWERSTDNGKNWAPIAYTGTTLSYSNLPSSTEFRAVIKSGECPEQYSSSTRIEIVPEPTKPAAGSDLIVCYGTSSIAMQANKPVVGSGLWTQIKGPQVTFDSKIKNDAIINGLQPGEHYQFSWQIANGICITDPSFVNIHVLKEVVNTIKADRSVSCRGEEVKLSTQVLKGGDSKAISSQYDFRWEQQDAGSDTWTLVNGGSGETISVFPRVTTKYRRQVSSYEQCETTSPIIEVIINPSAPESIAGDDKTLCNESSYQLSGNDPGSFVGTWEDVDPGSKLTFSPDKHTHNATLNNLVPGKSYTLKWTISGIEPCQDASSEMTVRVRRPATRAEAGADQRLCLDVSSSNNHTMLAGNMPDPLNGESGYWRMVSGPGQLTFENASAPTTRISNLSEGIYTLEWTIKTDATDAEKSCSESKDQVILSVAGYPTMSRINSPDLAICKGEMPGELSLGQYSPKDHLQWQISYDGSAFSDIPGATSSSYAPYALNSSAWFRVKISQPEGCGFSIFSNQVKVHVDEPSVGGEITVNKSRVCVGEPVHLEVLKHVGQVIRWEHFSAEGVWTPLAGLIGTSITYVPPATCRFRAIVRNGACQEAVSTELQVDVLPNVTVADAGPDQFHCNSAEFFLEGNAPLQGVGSWKQVQGPSCKIENPLSFKTKVSGAAPGVYVFKWSISNSVCDPSESLVSIYNYPPLENRISGNTTICSGQTIDIPVQDSKGGNGTYQYEWEISHDEQSWTRIENATLPGLTHQFTRSAYVRRTITSGPCLSVSNSVRVIVQPPITNNTISGNQTLCFGEPSSAITGSDPSGGDNQYTYKWQMSHDSRSWLDLVNSADKGYAPGTLEKTTWFRRLVTTSLCNGEQTSISESVCIIVNPLAKAEFSASTNQSCAPFDLKTVINLTTYEDRNSEYEWFANNVSIGKGITFPGYTLHHDGESVSIKLVTKSSFGCNEDSKELGFSTVRNVIAAFTKDQSRGCGPLEVNFTNTSDPMDKGNYLWDFGNGQLSTEMQPGKIIFQPHPDHRDTTYIISLKANSGCLTTEFRDSVLVRPEPRAVFSPDIVVGCSPLTVNFTNQSAGGPNRYTFDFGDGSRLVTTDSKLVSHTFQTLKTDTITVKLIAENECGADSSTHNIVIYPNTVTPELVVDGNRKFGCAPFTVKFKNNSVGASLFYWDFKDGNTATTTNAPAFVDHTFREPGVYEVSMLASNGCSSGLTTEVITVYGAPDARFTFENKRYCKNDPVTFSVQQSPSTTYSWDFGDGTYSNEANPQHIFLNAGIYTVRLTALQSHPDGSICNNVYTSQVGILPLPIANFTSNSSELNCAPFKLSVRTTPSDASSVHWDFGDKGSPYNIASGHSAEHIYTEPGTYKITEKAFNASGCVDSVTRTIEVICRPRAAFVASDSLICGRSGTLKFSNKSTCQSDDVLTFRWLVNGRQISTQENLMHEFVVPAGSKYPYTSKVQLIAQSVLGCPDTTTLYIKHNPLPVASFELKSEKGCAPFTLDIKNTSQYGDTFAWYLDGKMVSRDETPRIIAKLKDTTYLLQLIVSNKFGCKVDSTEKNFSTYPKPLAYFTIKDSLSCNGKLEVNTRNLSEGAVSYEWNFGDGSPVSKSASPAHLYGKPGTYYLRLTAFDGQCTDVMTRTIRIAAVPQAAFRSDVQKGCSQLTVTFQNLSVNASCYLWDFGDGTISTETHPTHRYTSDRPSYNVKLTSYGEFGCLGSTMQTQYIVVSKPPVAQFEVSPGDIIHVPNFTFTFNNSSEGKIVKYEWTFGDGSNSSEQNPSHTYREPGEYQVRLILTSDAGCSDTLSKTVRIEGVPGYLYVPSGFEPASLIADIKTFLPKGSGIAKYSLKIFNKWNQLIWQTDQLDDRGSPLEGWDGAAGGAPAPQGVYIWHIEAKFIDGTDWRGMKYEKGPRRTVGTINLIR